MKEVCWDFPLLGTGNQSGNNIAAITMFKGSGIMDGLAREVCQNSLDAKDKSLPLDTPVKVKFELVEIEKKEYSMFEGYQKALDSSIDYWSTSPLRTPKIMEFLGNVKKALDLEKIPVLIMSDYNTVGLNGVNAEQGEKSFWDLLVNVEGLSIKQDENSAGSFGIGKNAPFAYSALNLVFYNTLAQDGGRGFEGVARLVTTQKEYNGTFRPTQPIGKYLYLEDEYTGRPISPTDNCPLSQLDIFNRNEIGTDVAVFGFKTNEYEDWEKNIAIAIIKNFVLAILNSKLEVEIKSPKITYNISKSNVENLLFKDFSDEPQLKYTRQIYETLTKIVEPKKGENKGVISGNGKVKIVSPKIIDQRIFYKAANKYQFYVNSPQDYSRVFLQFYAGRDDDKNDPVVVKNVKLENIPRIDVNSQKIGPISLHQGDNTLFIEFENSEIMALVPVFTMEVVTNEKQSD